MKHVVCSLVTVVVFLMCGGTALAQISFAILPIEAKGGVAETNREEAESSLYQYLTESKKYKIIERSRIEEIMEEQAFQMTGATDQAKAVQIGKILGVEKLLASKLYLKAEDQLALSFSVIDVATAEVEFSREVSSYDYSAADHARFCASYIIAEYPLLGSILGQVKDIIVVNLGKNHGLEVGDRLFVARREQLVDEDGEILFQEINRVGILKVTRLDAVRAQTQAVSLNDPENRFQKEDLVSPEPIPHREAILWTEPLLADVVKGELLLDDDMEQRKYLSPTYNNTDDYINGELHLDASHKTSGHVYCYYPIPFDMLENIIIEGVMEFQPIEGHYNRFNVVLRNNGEYHSSDSYNFYWHDEGGFAVYRWRLSNPFDLVELQASPAIHRGEARNTFRIVAYGSKFDWYLNDEFVIGFDDEFLEKGRVGFMVDSGGYATVDDVKIWEAVKQPATD
ncbi:hypothetical protein GF339_19060 [candidate division KSB3 bacterium]|uniref:Flagellar assembly protein T C-terminal domain-containing protein n=1 Tax=candidate division KSB3 bacterium TaxID=2044937 RepID=A0A9D5JZJ9_9BACT|nr:hypothetical protein [candidate division KSB3 bacterium]MBD3326692.1 hypothetical protein [candidate division KSB3 bacterium]